MAKMFYSLEEAAERLGISEGEVADLVAQEKLKEYRDRNKRMFKADQVDALAGGDSPDAATADVVDIGDDTDSADEMADTGDISLDEATALSVGGNDDSGGLELTPEQNFSTGDTGGLELADDLDDGLSLVDDGPGDGMHDSATALESQSSPADEMNIDDDEPPAPVHNQDTRQATGISVFDADELDDIADPMAQTQTTTDSGSIEDEDLALESVGSGSGLLDLTRESDDTSLGAELLDEIYPGDDSDGSGVGSGAGHDTFDPTSLEMSETSAGDYDGIPSSSGLENITSAPDEDDVPLSGSGIHADFGTLDAGTPVGAGAAIPVAASEAYDPAGNLMTALMFLVALIALIIGMIIALSAINGAPNTLQVWMSDGNNIAIAAGALAAAAVVLGLVGFLVGKKFE